MINHNHKSKIKQLTIDLEKNITEIRMLKEERSRLINEVTVLREKNKMLKSWNE